MSEPDPNRELEQWVATRLKRLPPMPAPAGLAERVLAILTARQQKPWWRDVWWHWPWPAKLSFLLIGLALAGACGSGGYLFDAGVTAYSERVTERLTPLEGLWGSVTAVTDALVLLWSASQPLLLVGLLVAASLSILCLGLGMAVLRTVLKRI